MKLDDFENRLGHARAAYRYFAASLPPEAAFNVGAVRVGDFECAKKSQRESMLIELGWAFFVRFDAVLEVFLIECSVQVGGQKLFEWAKASGKFSEHELRGIEQYRDLRNTLHHDDGQPDPNRRKTLDVSEQHEPQFLEGHMEDWANLFLKIGRVASGNAAAETDAPRG